MSSDADLIREFVSGYGLPRERAEALSALARMEAELDVLRKALDTERAAITAKAIHWRKTRDALEAERDALRRAIIRAAATPREEQT